MELQSMYQIIDKENIDLLEYDLTNVKARIFQFEDKSYMIVLNSKKIENSIEEKEILAEELGHYYCNALYPITADKTIINKAENRAIKWSYSVLVPIDKLKAKIKENLDLYELAEYFDVRIEYMKQCLQFYKNKYEI